MVHTRLNEKETNPNPHINFITALPAHDEADQEDARQFLRALAAQVRPVMKAHGFEVNSLEEYEYNNVFAGRNWENGETIELVLRRPGGSFFSTSWLLSTFCHELAHIKHMNHGPQFQALWRRLRNEVRALQDKGYYGDGYWSAGIRLADSAVIAGTGSNAEEFPEYMCGGAQTRTRPSSLRRRRTGARRPREIIPSNHTGRQTAKRRKAGSRVTSKYAFSGEGTALNEGDPEDERKGTGFGKRANSKKAREERALAAERRIQMLQTQSSSSTSSPISPSHLETEDAESDEDPDYVPETDSDRRKALLDAEQGDVKGLKVDPSAWKEYESEFIFTGKGEPDVIELSDDENDCDIPIASGSTYVNGATASSSQKGKRKLDDQSTDTAFPPKQPKYTIASSLTSSRTNELGLGKLVETEVNLRKKEALGMAPVKGKGRTIGGTRSTSSLVSPDSVTPAPMAMERGPQVDFDNGASWACLVCTLDNKPLHLACSACGTPRGENSWNGQVT